MCLPEDTGSLDVVLGKVAVGNKDEKIARIVS
jgi:hypothetical protein